MLLCAGASLCLADDASPPSNDLVTSIEIGAQIAGESRLFRNLLADIAAPEAGFDSNRY